MRLSDQDIISAMANGDIVVDPFDTASLQPASIDLHLANTIKIFSAVGSRRVNPYEDQAQKILEINISDGRSIHPQEFMLASTIERIEISPNLSAQVAGCSSLARLGLVVENAGYFDPGWKGTATLELFNLSSLSIVLTPGMKICQIIFDQLLSPAMRPYGHPNLNSKYTNQSGPQESKFHLNKHP